MRPRPVHVNSWEGFYFDHDEAALMALATRAAALGVERFVLDDGWFRGRDDDTAALGDWTPDPRAYPRGLSPLADHVVAAGMEERVRLISFQESLLEEARRQAPELPRGIISGRALDDLFAIAARLECIAIHPQAPLLKPEATERCARSGLRLNTWTVNEAGGIRRAVEMGVHEITTDYPDLAHRTLVELGIR